MLKYACSLEYCIVNGTRSVAQLVERLVWDEEIPGSSPGTPTFRRAQCLRLFCEEKWAELSEAQCDCVFCIHIKK